MKLVSSMAHTVSYTMGSGGPFSEDRAAGAAHLHPEPRLRMRGATPTLSHTPSWCCASLGTDTTSSYRYLTSWLLTSRMRLFL